VERKRTTARTKTRGNKSWCRIDCENEKSKVTVEHRTKGNIRRQPKKGKNESEGKEKSGAALIDQSQRMNKGWQFTILLMDRQSEGSNRLRGAPIRKPGARTALRRKKPISKRIEVVHRKKNESHY